MHMKFVILFEVEFWLCAEGHKKKKKRFKLRHNQTEPYAEPPETSDGFERTESPPAEYADTPRRQLPQLKKSRSPQLDRLHEDSHGEEDGLCFHYNNNNNNNNRPLKCCKSRDAELVGKGDRQLDNK